MDIASISHKHTNMYIIGNDGRYVLYDCLWHDSAPIIKSALKEKEISFSQIELLFTSHFHPDHGGSFSFLQQNGVAPMVLDVQIPHIEWLNSFFSKQKNDPSNRFIPIGINAINPVNASQATDALRSCGIDGFVLHTPGHSEDSISLVIGDAAFVGDLPPYETAEGYAGSVAASWQSIIAKGAKQLYYAHANTLYL